MMINIPNPMVGNSASHVSYTGLPGPAHTVVINPNDNQPVLYEFGGNCGGTPTPTPTSTPTPTPTPTFTPTPTATPSPTPTPTPCTGRCYTDAETAPHSSTASVVRPRNHLTHRSSQRLCIPCTLRSQRAKINAVSIWFPMRCHSVGFCRRTESNRERNQLRKVLQPLT